MGIWNFFSLHYFVLFGNKVLSNFKNFIMFQNCEDVSYRLNVILFDYTHLYDIQISKIESNYDKNTLNRVYDDNGYHDDRCLM